MKNLASDLYRIQGEIIRLKRTSKKEFGSPAQWPDYVRARYDELKARAKECREMLGEAA